MNPNNPSLHDADREEQILKDLLSTYQQELALTSIGDEALADLLLHEQLNGTRFPDHPMASYYQRLKEKVEQTPEFKARFEALAEKLEQMPVGESPQKQFERLNARMKNPKVHRMPSFFRYAVAASLLVGGTYAGLRLHSSAVTPRTLVLADSIANVGSEYRMRNENDQEVSSLVYANMDRIERTRNDYWGLYPQYDQAVAQTVIRNLEKIRVSQYNLRADPKAMLPEEVRATFYLAKVYLIQGNTTQAKTLLQSIATEGDGPLLAKAKKVLKALSE